MLRHPLLASGLAVLAAIPASLPAGPESRSVPRGTPPAARPVAPVRFEANLGQAREGIRFLARARDLTAGFEGRDAILLLRGPDGSREVVRMSFPGAEGAAPSGEGGRLASRSHYFLGSDPAGWVTDVPHFPSLRLAGLRRGVDLRWRGAPGRRLRYDFLLAAGADPAPLRVEFDGIASLSVDPAGDLRVATAAGVLLHRRPVAWQEHGGRRVPVEAAFRILGERTAAVVLGPLDPALPTVVDPTLEYSTHLGGGGDDRGLAAAATASGAVVVVGKTGSNDFPTADPVQATRVPGTDSFGTPTTDVFVTKFTDDGSDLDWSTYLGGTGSDVPGDVAVDAAGAVILCGETAGTNFPVKNALQGTKGGGIDAFIAKLTALGNLDWSTFHGGSMDDSARGLAVDSSGAVFVAGSTASTNFPVKNAVQGTTGGGVDAWVSRLASDGSSLAWSTYHGGSGDDEARALDLDPQGNPTYAGATASSNFPVTAGVFQGTYGGAWDAFVARMKADGTSRSWSTFLGAALGTDLAHGIAVGLDGSCWVVGETNSNAFPLENPWQFTFKGGTRDGFAARLSSAGTSLHFSTYLGGDGEDLAHAVVLDDAGTAYVAGSTSSTNFYTLDPLQEAYGGGNSDIFLVRYHAAGNPMLFSTFLGGVNDDAAHGVALDGQGTVVLAGFTSGTDFDTADPYQGSNAGGVDGIAARVRMSLPTAPTFFTAILTGPSQVTVGWTDTTGGLAGHEVERRVGPGPYAKIADSPRGTRSVVDSGLLEQTTYTYRARAVAYAGPSAWTPEAQVTTPPTIPLAPTDLVAQVQESGSVGLTWVDNAYNEAEYLVYRGVGGGAGSLLAALPAGTVQYEDAAARPDRNYRYTVRAGNSAGPSGDSNDATAVTPKTLDVGVARGKLSDSTTEGKDSLKVAGILAPAFGVTPAALDPASTGFEVWLGGRGAPPLVAIGPGDPTWRVRNGKYKWKSAKGELPKVKVLVDSIRRSFSVSVTKADFVPTPANPIFIGVDAGEADAGSLSANWSTKKTGKYRFP